jgi:hypothetical protein
MTRLDWQRRRQLSRARDQGERVAVVQADLASRAKQAMRAWQRTLSKRARNSLKIGRTAARVFRQRDRAAMRPNSETGLGPVLTPSSTLRCPDE